MPVNDFAMNRNVAIEAADQGLTLSAFLERLDPTTEYSQHEQDMDAFERQLARLDIRTQSDPTTGMIAHPWERWYNSDDLSDGNERVSLAAEWLNRMYKRNTVAGRALGRMAYGGKMNARGAWADLAASARFPVDIPTNFTLFPPAVYDQLRFQEIQPSALQYLIARTRMIDSEAFVALYLQNDSAGAATQLAARLKRVEEFGEPNIWSFVTAENTTRVKKYANALRLSYEQMRRMSIDLVGWGVSYMAQLADRDKEDTAVDILVNGDGNSGSAATNTNGSTLDAAAAGAMTLKMWLKWRYLWVRPYTCRVIIAPSADLVNQFLLSAGSANVGPQNYLQNNQQNAMNVTPVRTVLEGVLAVDNSTVSANTLLGIDSAAALEMVLESNSNIVQMDQVIRNQYNEIIFSENVGWDIAILKQNRTLAYTA
jgi:hypothetical protein